MMNNLIMLLTNNLLGLLIPTLQLLGCEVGCFFVINFLLFTVNKADIIDQVDAVIRVKNNFCKKMISQKLTD